ncbi:MULTISPECIES: nuclear transport factor 2 family protein [unclassified Novosphingobium]|uniref:nuclear transport factor 2 family protein n=1 Tax=unclassified Novosphingobium TaxID=2644732 RepID=UPI001493FADA|nr:MULTISPECIES: nuclear transport factor 2 family protein [unclassified Novosphingobium]MBB3358309.1 putative SnoaL-like aldol condensation-catalyzing enzyme [Novosphingobium sp. BK256]MBB3374670.1 putative SnoaL-like aldol condensation-catalyzing enzyme [Novosphingobium sp. BK280]MBB3379082.1 putative SnoaL-like aldol condensation-catalyzing enzyme [Novosphingobium sp. BK258]MBB3420776.1 putative SnoaL-like aldol condensation-catalyzing enzyme [Novosphingobium sp. BK267]MBB3448102.1 putative
MALSSLLFLAAAASAPAAVPPSVTVTPPAARVVVLAAKDQRALLASADRKLAANKRLVFDMYRIVLQAGDTDRAHEFIATDYIQHNPNAAQGLAGLIAYVKATRPVRPVLDHLEIPMIHIMAEGDYVTIAFARPETDAAGQRYVTTWFDLFRIAHGRIAEHWDPMLRSDRKIDPNKQKLP